MKQARVLIYNTLKCNFSKFLISKGGLAFNRWSISTLHLKTIMKWIYQHVGEAASKSLETKINPQSVLQFSKLPNIKKYSRVSSVAVSFRRFLILKRTAAQCHLCQVLKLFFSVCFFFFLNIALLSLYPIPKGKQQMKTF